MKRLLNKFKKQVEKYSNTATIETFKNKTTGYKMIKIKDTKDIYIPNTILKNCSISAYTNGNKVVLIIHID